MLFVLSLKERTIFPMFLRRCKFALVCLALALPGCDDAARTVASLFSPGRPPALAPVTLPARPVRPKACCRALARVLEAAVTEDGLADANRLRGRQGDLDEQIHLLAVTGPTATPGLFPTAEARAAYWLNARAAWSLKLWLDANCPARIAPEALVGRSFPLDGGRRTLAGIDRALHDEMGWRAVVAAPGVGLDRAALPREPFCADGVGQVVRARIDAFVTDEARFAIDIERKQVRVPPVLWRFEREILREHRQRGGTDGKVTLRDFLLLHLGHAPRKRLQDALGYEMVEARYDKGVRCVPAP